MSSLNVGNGCRYALNLALRAGDIGTLAHGFRQKPSPATPSWALPLGGEQFAWLQVLHRHAGGNGG